MTTSRNYTDLFLPISAWLTGFDTTELQATGMTATYYATITTKNTASCIDDFFAQAELVLQEGGGDEDKTNSLIASQLFPTSCYNNLAQNIITMWYTGEWAPDVNAAPSLAEAHNISPNAYVQGLMWTAASTHPPGAKQPGYGSWADPPIGPPVDAPLTSISNAR